MNLRNKFTLYIFAGCAAVLIHIIVLNFMFYFLKFNKNLSYAIGFLFGNSANYCLQAVWVFKKNVKLHSYLHHAFSNTFVAIVGLLIFNIAVLFVNDINVSTLISIALIFFVNFLYNFKVVFK